MTNGRQKAVKRKRETALALMMRCEWVDCAVTSTDIDEFSEHVEGHAKEEHKEEKEGREYLCCMWQLCGFTSIAASTIHFHVNYHSHHTHLKALGTAILAQPQNTNLDCHQDITQRNMVGLVSDVRACEWEACDFYTDSYSKLLQHTRTHVTGQPRRTKHQIVYCLWQGCGRSQKDMTKLKSHVRIHTQEKAVACPVCGTQFASKTKFKDHCARQAPLASRLSKCSYCKKRFPSERILQDHFRVHTHMYKCPMCDMTCPYKYTLALHMRYRHLKHRPFLCTFCQQRFTTERDLKSHYQSHSEEDLWVCGEDGCDFRARSSNGFAAHMWKTHGLDMPQYGCHICDAIYHRGAALTQHLKREHSYRWASGMSRFRYIKDESGVHRLQTVRHESLEVVEQIMANATIRRPRQRKRRFDIAGNTPDSIIITEQPTSSRDESDEDDPDEMNEKEEEEGEQSGSECESAAASAQEHSDMPDLASSPISTSQPEDDDDSFGECLKQHLGLVGGFIKVVAANKHLN